MGRIMGPHAMHVARRFRAPLGGPPAPYSVTLTLDKTSSPRTPAPAPPRRLPDQVPMPVQLPRKPPTKSVKHNLSLLP